VSTSANIRLEPASDRGFLSAVAVRHCVWLIPAFSLAVVVEIFIPKFGTQSPSLVDDWFQLTYAPTAVHQLIHGHYDPAVVDYGGRYRPSYALLSAVQWMFGSRNSTLGPNLVGLVRVLFFAAVVAVIVGAVLRRTASRPWLIVTASIVPTMVVAAPGVSYNFVRFGIAEPTSFAAVAIGLICMTAGIQRALQPGAMIARRGSGLMFTAGYATYLFGAYMSEACAAVVFLLPSLYYWISHEPGFVRNRRATAVLSAAAILTLLPIVHVFWEIAPNLGSDHGSHSIRGMILQLVRPVGPTFSGLLTTGDLIWPLLIAVTFALSARRALRREREAILILGMILSGFAAAYIAELGMSGTTLSRYYIPLLVAIGVGFVWLLGQLHAFARSIIIATVIAFIFAGRGDLAARYWLHLDHAGDTAIVFASWANATGCPVYLVDFPDERRVGLARVLDKTRPGSLPTCQPAAKTAYAVWWRLDSETTSPATPPGCASGWHHVTAPGSVELLRCPSFSSEVSFPIQDTRTRTRMVRLAPPRHWINASVLNQLAYARH
jgi:hypothetical protein